ncbi:MAG: DUF1957 domain-containing protein, partial [Ignavibacteriales bacterium]|nr:DUF1957 domain-containing protein [Ignavibacteriales bacterium]
QLYDVEKIEDRIENQATHFVGLIQSVLEKNFTTTGKEGILCAPYDAELFGHWWFEGPRFLKKVLQKLERETTLQLTTASEELDKRKPRDVIALPEGSWGEGNNHQVWLSDKTAWTWKLVYECERKFREILSLYFSPMEEHSESEGELLRNILEQAARELLILEASDWQFLISQKSAKDYAERRILEHTSSFQQLIAFAGKILRHLPLETQELSFLETCKLKDGLFEQIDLRWWMKM